jgi:hypothetical protein
MAEIDFRVVEVQRFALQDGDRLVLRIPPELEEDAELIAQQVQIQFPGYPILVMCGGIELDVVRAQVSDG